MLDQDSARCLCYDHERSTFDRPALWIPVIGMPCGIQVGSLLPYTAFVALGTFSAQRGMQPYFFECPIVQQTMPRLLRRHGVFLVAIILFETIALGLTRYLPASWLREGKGSSPFAATLFITCLCLAGVQAFTNRTLLERAHREKHVLPQTLASG